MNGISYNKKSILEKLDIEPTENSTNPVTSGGVKTYVDTGLHSKQDALTFDTSPTENSTNPVTSEGIKTYVDNHYVTAGQQSGTTLGSNATAEGGGTTASGMFSHAEGGSTTASGIYSHAEGDHTTASRESSHAEGRYTEASNDYSHAEGFYTDASGAASHAEGGDTTASGLYSHAEGNVTKASGAYSHAEGQGTVAQRNSQHVFGAYNVLDTAGTSIGQYVEIVGNGTAGSRSNARTLDWDGNEVLAGKLTVGADPTDSMDVATKEYVDSSTSGKQDVLTFDSVPIENSTNPVVSGGIYEELIKRYPSKVVTRSEYDALTPEEKNADIVYNVVGDFATSDVYTKSQTDALLAAKPNKDRVFQVILTTAGWSNNSQTATNSNFVVSGYAYIVSPSPVNFAQYTESQIYADDVTVDNQMTFHCESTPTSEISVTIIRSEVQ